MAALAGAMVALVGCSDDDLDSASASASASATTPTLATTPTSTVVVPPEGTEPPPADVDDLVPGLLGTDDVGIPETWAIRDLDASALADPAVAADADPLLGIVVCPEGVMVPSEPAWLSRRFAAPEAPLPGGLLSIEVLIARGDRRADAARLGECTVADQPIVVATTTTADLVSFSVTAEPSADVPFPSVMSVARRSSDGFSVTVVMAGLDEGTNWEPDAIELTQRVLDRLE